MRDRDRICSWIARVPGAGRLAALATASAVAALLALLAVGGASADAGPGGFPNGSRPLPANAFGGMGLPGLPGSSVPSPGHNSVLSAVACVKASDCWAVGDHQNGSGAFLNEALRWNGRKWSPGKTPNPGGIGSEENQSELFGVACVSASDCWGVGESERGSSAPELNEVLHFNGKKWSKVKAPSPGGNASGDLSELRGVTCVSASDCWAVGETKRGGSAPALNEALRWNGKRWSKVKTPSPGGISSGDLNELFAVACVSRSDCWAVGETQQGDLAAKLNEALHFNGKKWSKVNPPDPAGKDNGKTNELLGVDCVSARDCWAVGEGANPNKNVAFNEVLHWRGKKWAHVRTPQPSNVFSEFFNPLSSVYCNSANDCWAVGWYVNKRMTALLNEALHWNGRKWSHVHTPQPGGTNNVLNALIGVTCSSRSDCRSVGATGPIEKLSNEVLRWNGKRWSSQ